MSKTAARKTTTKPARETKQSMVLAMIARKNGATLDEIMAAAGWLRHTVRGFVSVQARKPGIAIGSTKGAAGERRYKITK